MEKNICFQFQILVLDLKKLTLNFKKKRLNYFKSKRNKYIFAARSFRV